MFAGFSFPLPPACKLIPLQPRPSSLEQEDGDDHVNAYAFAHDIWCESEFPASIPNDARSTCRLLVAEQEERPLPQIEEPNETEVDLPLFDPIRCDILSGTLKIDERFYCANVPKAKCLFLTWKRAFTWTDETFPLCRY